MDIDMTKKYQTRDGDVIVLHRIIPPQEIVTPFPVIGFILYMNGSSRRGAWTLQGRAFLEGEHSNDLVLVP